MRDRAQSGDIVSTVVVNPTRSPELKRQISTDVFPQTIARSLPTVRLCRMYSRREPPIRWTRHPCRSNIPRSYSPPDITMGCTPCHHAPLLNRSRAHCPIPTFPSVIRLLLPRLLPQAPANPQSSWRLLSAVMLSHPLQTLIKRRRYPPTPRMDLSRPASVRSRLLPTASPASPVPSIQNPEASMSTPLTSIPTRDGNHSKCPVFFSLHSQSLITNPSSVLDHFSNLGIEGHITTSPTDSANRSPEQVHSSENTSGVNTAYASPTSNMSNGGSPHQSTKPIRFSLTSELASALSANPDGSVPYVSCQSASSPDS